MLSLGVIGVGPRWDSSYLPALKKLGNRVRVRAVYDSIAGHCRLVAQSLDAEPAKGILDLVERPSVQAVLLLDSAWFGTAALNLVLSAGKPLYVATPLGNDLGELERIHAKASNNGVMVVPELDRRYTPATGRLQELMATQLGRPLRIQISGINEDVLESDHTNSQITSEFVGWIDWCSYIFRDTPIDVMSEPDNRIETQSTAVRADEFTARLMYAGRRDSIETTEFAEPDNGRPLAELVVCRTPSSDDGRRHVKEFPRVTVECQRGIATIRGVTEITWSNGELSKTESLLSDRSEIQVILDLFCRRAVGGLIPVTDLSDVCQSTRTAKKALDSRHGQNTSAPDAGCR